MNAKQMADIFNAQQMDVLAAKVNELYTFGETTMMKQTQTEVNAYGNMSVFYVPCGECGNPMFVSEVYQTAVLLECAACGHASVTDRLSFVETCYITIDANDFNQASENNGEQPATL